MQLKQIATRRAAETAAGGLRHRRTSAHAADPRECAARADGRPALRHRDRPRDADHRALASLPGKRGAGDHGRRAQAAGPPARAARGRRCSTIDGTRQPDDASAPGGRASTCRRCRRPTIRASASARIRCRRSRCRRRDFRGLLKSAEFAMAQQDIRYYLNGMLLVIDKGSLQAVATDGHRLSWASIAIAGDYQRQEVILPRKTVLELIKLLARYRRSGDARHPREPGALPLREHRAREQGRRRQVPRLQPRDPDGPHQAHRARRAPSSSPRCSGRRSCRTRSSAACGSCSRNDQLKIICTNSEQEEAEEELEIDYNGDALDIGFNITYLLDVLQNMAMDRVAARVRRRQFERARHGARARRLQVRRDADAHLTPRRDQQRVGADRESAPAFLHRQSFEGHDDSSNAEARATTATTTIRTASRC